MTERCPNEECHNRLQEARKAIFGEDGIGGLLGCVQAIKRKMVPKAMVWAVLVLIGIPLFATGVKVWFGYESSALRFADAQAVSALRERMSIQETQFSNMCVTLNEIKSTLLEVRRDVKALEK